jgi:hypothetical protein
METKCLLEGCDKPTPKASGRGRKKLFCSDAHRKAHSRINGHERRKPGFRHAPPPFGRFYGENRGNLKQQATPRTFICAQVLVVPFILWVPPLLGEGAAQDHPISFSQGDPYGNLWRHGPNHRHYGPGHLGTGGGFAVRQLYTDQDEVLFDAARPVILNGIEDIVERPDLADRAMFLTLEPIAEEHRRPEAGLWAAFETERPRILGALLNAVVEGLKRLPETRLPKLPRMADFALWATACETALWPVGTFWSAYSSNLDETVEGVIEANSVATAVRAFMSTQPEWAGTASDLLRTLASVSGERIAKSKDWPGNPRSLSGRFAPQLSCASSASRSNSGIARAERGTASSASLRRKAMGRNRPHRPHRPRRNRSARRMDWTGLYRNGDGGWCCGRSTTQPGEDRPCRPIESRGGTAADGTDANTALVLGAGRQGNDRREQCLAYPPKARQ